MSNVSPIVAKAIDFAVKHHKNDVRKGTRIPYLVHLFNVSKILAEADADDEVMAAGLLHDAVEDTDATIGELESEFGERIAGIVTACTEKYKLDKSQFEARGTWEERKQHTIDEISKATNEQLLVILADKLDNIRSIQADYRKLNDGLWTRFNAGKEKQKWYYGCLIAAARKGNTDEKTVSLITELESIYKDVFEV